ncbi:MAG: glycosyl hydrolase 53 family protein, partial [Bacteroidaceae bacterium]|nr:glycosyl hydrolase 53 family protein [Bacteroidaceae bacterium]
MKKTILAISLFLTAFLPAVAQHFVGGDISMLPLYESKGAQYKTNSGTAIPDMLEYFKSEKLNSMRVRLFVDPSKATADEQNQGVKQDLAYVKALGKRIKDSGFSFMLDFHYSDTWADPVKQFTPSNWLSLSETELQQKIYDYTKDCLQQLKEAGAEPDFIQTGNEINYGILWGDRNSKTYYAAGTSGQERFMTLLKQASKACREVCPNAKIIMHTERVAKLSTLTAFINDLQTYSVDYDIIGLSYYPYWHGNLATLNIALTVLERDYADKKIM